MILADIARGDGVAVVDPHGDLINRLLCLIPESDADRVIHFDPGDPDWILLWNIVKPEPDQDPAGLASDLVLGFKQIVNGWGDRLETILRNCIYGASHLPNGTLRDVSRLLRNKSEDGLNLQRQIAELVENDEAELYWAEDHGKYTKEDIAPPRHKLSKLLLCQTLNLMFSQPESRLNFREIMDKRQILLVNLSTLRTSERDLLGSFLLGILHRATLSRSSISPDKRNTFHIHCDEAHRFLTESLEDAITEARKYGVSLTLAHQYLAQLDRVKAGALASVGTTITFNVDTKDARTFIRNLHGKATLDDLVQLEPYQAIARINMEVVRMKTLAPPEIPVKHCREAIIKNSRERYYRPAREIKEMLRNSRDKYIPPAGGAVGEDYNNDDFAFEEFK